MFMQVGFTITPPKKVPAAEKVTKFLNQKDDSRESKAPLFIFIVLWLSFSSYLPVRLYIIHPIQIIKKEPRVGALFDYSVAIVSCSTSSGSCTRATEQTVSFSGSFIIRTP